MKTRRITRRMTKSMNRRMRTKILRRRMNNLRLEMSKGKIKKAGDSKKTRTGTKMVGF